MPSTFVIASPLAIRSRSVEMMGSHAPSGALELLAPSAEVDAFTSDDEPFAVGDRDHFGVVPLLAQVRLSLRELAQERAADVTDADNRERKRLASLKKYLMDHVE